MDNNDRHDKIDFEDCGDRTKSWTRTWVSFGGATNTPRSDTNEKKAIIDFFHQRSTTIALKKHPK